MCNVMCIFFSLEYKFVPLPESLVHGGEVNGGVGVHVVLVQGPPVIMKIRTNPRDIS